MKKTLISLMTIGLVAVVAVFATQAFFSDTETSNNNTFTAGEIDLTVDAQINQNSNAPEGGGFEAQNLNGRAIFTYTDLKPGDMGDGYLSIHGTSNDYWACIQTVEASYEENGRNDAELDAGDTTSAEGELQNYMTFAFWNDLNENGSWDGTPTDRNLVGPWLEGIVTHIPNGLYTVPGLVGAGWLPLADISPAGFFSENPLTPGTQYNLGFKYCFGDMTYDSNSETINCDGEGEQNDAQTDRVRTSMEFYAVQSRNNGEFQCATLNEEVSQLDLENKDDNNNWVVIEDSTYGTFNYSTGTDTFYGSVYAQGLVANAKYQVTLNGPGSCTATDVQLATAGTNNFESGYWNSGTNLESTCDTPGEGVYNMNLINDHYTVETDSNGDFYYPFNLDLPSGSYSGVKVLVKKMLDTHESPWVDSSAVAEQNLYETSAISFDVN